MAKHKKRLGRPPTGKNAMIAIRWHPVLIEGIDKYAQKEMLPRPGALRQIVTRFLAEEGYINPDEMFIS